MAKEHELEDSMETICFSYRDDLESVTIDPNIGDIFDAKIVFDKLCSEGYKVTVLAADEIVIPPEAPYIVEHVGLDVAKDLVCDLSKAKDIYDKLISYKPISGYFACYTNEDKLNRSRNY